MKVQIEEIKAAAAAKNISVEQWIMNVLKNVYLGGDVTISIHRGNSLVYTSWESGAEIYRRSIEKKFAK